MYLIVGLGNPGAKYEKTRHNMGFRTIDSLADKYGIKVDKLKAKALIGDGRIGTEKVLLVKPQTFMNLSGFAVAELMNFYKIPVENLIVIYDDIDLETGRLRLRAKGSAGTHNGMRDIVQKLGDNGFPRIRIGIGSDVKGDLADYVTGKLSKAEEERVKDVINMATEAAASIVEDGIDRAMNRYNTLSKEK
ncbi:MAG: aminoacyl-tRNA hydrolase [Clostridia bacterium]|nr:aminoacyl-tRNA hydrolase [Clostridia bacterium]